MERKHLRYLTIRRINLAHIRANHLENPASPGSPMILALYQNEIRTLAYRLLNGKLLHEYHETSTGDIIPEKIWTPPMKAFAQEQSGQVTPLKRELKLRPGGWLLLLVATALLCLLIFTGP